MIYEYTFLVGVIHEKKTVNYNVDQIYKYILYGCLSDTTLEFSVVASILNELHNYVLCDLCGVWQALMHEWQSVVSVIRAKQLYKT